MTHSIHLRTRDITVVENPDDDDANLKVEDGEENKKEEDDDMEVLDKDTNGTIGNDREDRPKNTKEVTTHSCEDINSKQALWTISK